MSNLYTIPKTSIARMEIYSNTGKKTIRQIAELKKPDIACTLVFYNTKWKPCCPLKKDGVVLWSDPKYAYEGIGWDTGEDLHPIIIPAGGESPCKNYFANCILASNGKKKAKLYYNPDVAGPRGRLADVLTDENFYLFASVDGTSMAKTPEKLRDYLYTYAGGTKIQSSTMHDGGTKVNFYNRAAGITIQGKEPSQNLLLIWLKDDAGKKTETVDKPLIGNKPTVKTVTASALRIRSAPGKTILGVFLRGAKVTLLEVRGGWSRVSGTNANRQPAVGWVSSAYLK